jgi:hypothetical protein
MKTPTLIWLRADYHLPALYSCRVPMTSITSARALPAPGPATIRLALIRTGIEVFGLDSLQHQLFPSLREIDIRIRPPEKVALSFHRLRAYKVAPHAQHLTEQITEAPISREMAHAHGPLSIYLQVPFPLLDPFRQLLQMVGSWGQASSLAWCCCIEAHQPPPTDECVIPLRLFQHHRPLHPFFSSLLSEFRDPHLPWQDVIPLLGNKGAPPLQLDVYVWPLVEVFHHGSGRLLQRQSFTHPLPPHHPDTSTPAP